jgi:hypothetical protein
MGLSSVPERTATRRISATGKREYSSDPFEHHTDQLGWCPICLNVVHLLNAMPSQRSIIETSNEVQALGRTDPLDAFTISSFPKSQSSYCSYLVLVIYTTNENRKRFFVLLHQLPYPEGNQHHALSSISHALSNKESCYHLHREEGLAAPPGAVVVNFGAAKKLPQVDLIKCFVHNAETQALTMACGGLGTFSMPSSFPSSDLPTSSKSLVPARLLPEKPVLVGEFEASGV